MQQVRPVALIPASGKSGLNRDDMTISTSGQDEVVSVPAFFNDRQRSTAACSIVRAHCAVRD